MSLGEKVQALRIERGLSQRLLAKKCDVSNATISRIEQDLVFPEYETLIKLANSLNVKVDYLMGKDDTPPPVFLEDAYFHFGKTAQDLKLTQDDMDMVMAIFKHHKDKNSNND